MRAAWELGARLPEIGTLLEAGILDAPKARLIAEIFAGPVGRERRPGRGPASSPS